MKNTIIYSLLVLGIFSFSSCEKFLGREPIAQTTPDNLFTSEQNAESAVMGMYRTMLSVFSYGQSAIIVPEFSARHVNHIANYPEYVEYKENRIRIDNPWTANIWNASYAAINAANNIIVRVAAMPSGSISDVKRQQLIREGKFVRALNYFLLVRAFGEVPLVINPTQEGDNLQVSRDPITKIYNQIAEDLTDASELPANYTNLIHTKGRATKYAAKALLAKVRLYQAKYTNDYSEAARLAKEVIDDGGFVLSDEFSDIWSKENTPESIFELQFDEQAVNSLASVSNPSPSVLFFAEGQSIANLYEVADIRRNFTVYQNTANNPDDQKYYIGKYRKYNPATQNVPLIRLGELLLIHAEAQARVDDMVSVEAYNSYKAIQDRANSTAIDRNSFITVGDFVKAVQREKRREMMFEGEAWFDYCRTGLALTEMMTVSDANYFLYPIPDGQRLINTNLSQNDGY